MILYLHDSFYESLEADLHAKLSKCRAISVLLAYLDKDSNILDLQNYSHVNRSSHFSITSTILSKD